MLKAYGMRQHYHRLLPFISSKKLMIWVLSSFVTNIFVLPWSHKNAVILDVLQGFVTIRRSKYSWKTDFSLIEDAERVCFLLAWFGKRVELLAFFCFTKLSIFHYLLRVYPFYQVVTTFVGCGMVLWWCCLLTCWKLYHRSADVRTIRRIRGQ